MTATMSPTIPARSRSARAPLARAVVCSGLVAAAATTSLAAVVHGAGVSLDADGSIPLFAFAQMTLLGALGGGALAAVFRRFATTPRRAFVRTTGALTALTCIPSVALPPAASTKIALVATHLVAAAIVIPALARRIAD